MEKRQVLESIAKQLWDLGEKEKEKGFKFLLAIDDEDGLHISGRGSHVERMGLAEAVKIKARVDLIQGFTQLEKKQQIAEMKTREEGCEQ